MRKKIVDMTTYLHHNKREFKLAFLPDVVIVDYIEWLFGEHHVILKYKTVQGEFDCRVDNHTFDEWLIQVHPRNKKK